VALVLAAALKAEAEAADRCVDARHDRPPARVAETVPPPRFSPIGLSTVTHYKFGHLFAGDSTL
jgi:hypothetical protein